MNTPKPKIRKIMLAILAKSEPVEYPPNQLSSLFRGIAEVLARQADKRTHDPRLSKEDDATATEVFWDLVLERIVTPGMNEKNLFPFFRVHSEAVFPDDSEEPS